MFERNLTVTCPSTGSIGNEALVHQHSLRFLNVSRNVIANVDPAAFKGLALLQKMDLSFNKISRMPDKLFQGNPLLSNQFSSLKKKN